MSLGRIRRVLGFITLWAVAIAVMVLPAQFPNIEKVVFRPNALFVLVVVAASLCVLTSAWLISVAHRKDLPEVGFVGLWFLVLSVLPLVHGLTTPGVLYEASEAFTASVFIAGPLAAMTALPTLFRTTRWANWVALRWRAWALIWTVVALGVAGILLISPNAAALPGIGTRTAILSALPTVGLAALYSWRHFTLAAISGSRIYATVFVGFVLTGASNLVWVTSVAYGPTFWLAHFLDISGVFAGSVGGAVAYLNSTPPSNLVGPILKADPLVALDLSLDVAVGEFIAELEKKDAVTRDHVLRTAESAIQVALALRLDPITVRDTGLAAVLHDIGKLEIPDSVLNKPGRLDDADYELMKSHAAIGGRLLRQNPALASVAHIVRAHHERIDGGGYPDGLAGDEIPIASRIVAVCDAYDAMAHDRPYRAGMDREKALAILREHSESQWDRAVVTEFVRLVEKDAVRTAPTVLDQLGRGSDSQSAHIVADPHHDACGCAAALPEDVAQELFAR